MTKNPELFKVIYDVPGIAKKYVDVKIMQETFIDLAKNAVDNSEEPDSPDTSFLDIYFKSETTKSIFKAMDTNTKNLTIQSIISSEEGF